MLITVIFKAKTGWKRQIYTNKKAEIVDDFLLIPYIDLDTKEEKIKVIDLEYVKSIIFDAGEL